MFGDQVERVWMHSSENDTQSFTTFPFGLSALYFSDEELSIYNCYLWSSKSEFEDDLNSEDDYRTGCRNVSQPTLEFNSGGRLFGRYN